MPDVIASPRLVLSSGDRHLDGKVSHIVSPFLIGLVGAVVGTALLAPGLLRQPHLIVGALLIPSMLLAVGIYVWTVFNPGDVVGLIVDRDERMLELVQANRLASRRTRIAFEDVARAAIEATYDQDGYASRVAVMTLSTGERVMLAFDVEEAQLAELRRLLGLASR